MNKDAAGGMMTTEFLALPAGLTVKDAIGKIRLQAQKKIPVSYVYVTDGGNRLKGVLNMRDLVLADDNALLESVMIPNVLQVEAEMDRETVVHKVKGHSLLSVPVVDREGRLIGVIRTDQLIAAAQEEATEDIQKMFGAGGDEHVSSPLSFSLRKRLPWLQINLLTAFLAVSVIAVFENVIARMTVLAVFLPVVASQGGNAGAQSLAVVMRGLVLREVEPRLARQVIWKEGILGLTNGILIGIVSALIAWLWGRNMFLGVVIGLAMIINMVCAGISGAAIPIVMQALGKDPAQSSNIILTTVTDVVGFLAFLGLAVVFQNFIVS